MKRRLSLTLIFIGGLIVAFQAQTTGGFYAEPDTVPEIEYEYVPTTKANIFAGRPGRAALYSLILPGAGQAYNKKYWQVPIVWAGVGTAGGIMLWNNKQYKRYRDAYRGRLIAEIEMVPPEDEFLDYSTSDILNYRDQTNRFRQISIFVFALTWIANSAQAYVGAHLKDFDVSDDLSLEIIPFSGSSVGDMSLTNYTSPVSTGIVIKF